MSEKTEQDREREPHDGGGMDELTALRTTVEEGNEIISEMSAALAMLCGEELKACRSCSGHLGDKAHAKIRQAYAAWEDLTAQRGALLAAAQFALSVFTPHAIDLSERMAIEKLSAAIAGAQP